MSIEALKKMAEAGLSLEQAIEIMEAMGGGSRTANAERQRRFRAKKKGVSVTDNVTRNATDNEGSFLSPSPTPPSTNLSPVTPYSPPKQADPKPKTPSLAEQIFLLQPKQFRRSTTPDIRAALSSAVKRGADGADILAAVRAYYALPASREDDGKFAKGAHRLIERDRWRDYLPRPDPPAEPATEAERAWRINHYRDTREWRSEWGEKPKMEAA